MADYADFIPDAAPPTDTSDFVPDMPVPNMAPASKVLKGNVAAAKAEANPEQHEARTFADDWAAGWQQSTMALGLTRQKMPDTVLPEHADRIANILAMAGNFAGDVPAMVLGMVGGGIAGAVGGAVAGSPLGGIPGAAAGAVIGTPVGITAGAFALPAVIRQVLTDHYKKGDIQDFGDFYDRASAALLSGLKQGGIGAAVGVTGALTGGALPLAASPLLKLGAVTGAEAAVMTTAGAAMEGQVPKADDFINNAAFMVLMHGTAKAVGLPSGAIKNKMLDVYSKTGLNPYDVSAMGNADPVLRQELLSKDPTIPESLKAAVDKGAEAPAVEIAIKKVNKLDGLSSATHDEEHGSLKVEPLTKKEAADIAPFKRSENVNAVLSRIGEQPDAPKEKIDFNEIYRKTLDSNDPFKIITKALLGDEAIGSKEDPYGLFRALGNVSRKGDEIIENGSRDFNTLKKTGTPGLTDIWAQAKDLKEYRAYQIAKHAVDLESQGIKTGVPIEHAKATVEELRGKYEKIAKQEVKFGNDNIDYLADSGIIGKEHADTMKSKYENYVAMKRIMGVDEQQSGKGGSGNSPANPLKKIKGSERQIVDPLVSRIKDTHQIIALAEKNRASLALTELIDKANKNGDTSWGTLAKAKMSAIELTSGETAKILEKQGFSKEDAADLDDVSTIFRAAKTPLADDQIVSYKNGKRQLYEGVPKGIVEAVRGLDAQSTGTLVKMLSPPSKMLRIGMLNSPAFAFRHFFRQEVLATALSKDLHIPVIETIKGMHGMLGEDFGDWIMHGGGGDSIAEMDKNYIQSKIFDLNEQTGFLDKGWNKVTNALQFFKHGIELTDEARTFQKYRNRVKSGDTVDNFQASFDARDTGIDVQRSGANMKAYMALDPFQGIKIQGLDLIGRRIAKDPMTVVPKLLATITIPSIYLWATNHDKNWYKELTSQDRDTNWHFSVGDPDKDGHIVRVPKPFEPGVVFGALPERLMDAYFTDNPHALKGFMKTIHESVTPGYVPTFLQPIVEQFANKSFLTDSPLIPHNMETVLPEYQSKTYTSDVSKVLASGLRQIPHFAKTPGSIGSPAILDNYLKNWTGGVGQLVLSGVDTALEKSGLADKMGVDYNHYPPESVWSDNPFLRSFILRNPSTNTRSVGDFFDRFSEVQTRFKTIENRKQAMDFPNMQKEMRAAAAAGELVRMEKFKQTISEQMALTQKVTVLPGMDPHEKRQTIDQLATSINTVAKEANKLMDDIEKKAAGE